MDNTAVHSLLTQVRNRLATLPRGRMVNASSWDALDVRHAQDLVVEVAAEFGVQLDAGDPA